MESRKPYEILARELAAVGAPIALASAELHPHDHATEADCATCREWNGREVTVRTGHTFRLALRHRQAVELRDYVERVAALNEEEAVLEALVFAAAAIAAPRWLASADYRVTSAERDLRTTRRDTYHYEQVLDCARAEAAAVRRLTEALDEQRRAA